jgi:hypothetical protein
MASKDDKIDIRNAKRSATAMKKGGLRISASAAKAFNKETRNANKAGKGASIRTTSSGFRAANSVSATKPSVASKVNAKNKMKAQGAKAMGAPTSGYGKSTKPKK